MMTKIQTVGEFRAFCEKNTDKGYDKVSTKLTDGQITAIIGLCEKTGQSVRGQIAALAVTANQPETPSEFRDRIKAERKAAKAEVSAETLPGDVIAKAKAIGHTTVVLGGKPEVTSALSDVEFEQPQIDQIKIENSYKEQEEAAMEAMHNSGVKPNYGTVHTSGPVTVKEETFPVKTVVESEQDKADREAMRQQKATAKAQQKADRKADQDRIRAAKKEAAANDKAERAKARAAAVKPKVDKKSTYTDGQRKFVEFLFTSKDHPLLPVATEIANPQDAFVLEQVTEQMTTEYEVSPMWIGAMVSTLREKAMIETFVTKIGYTDLTGKVLNERGRKCFRFTEHGVAILKANGVIA